VAFTKDQLMRLAKILAMAEPVDRPLASEERKAWKELVAEVINQLGLAGAEKDEFSTKASVTYWDDLADGIQAEEAEK
jgi:hypothetical protein